MERACAALSAAKVPCAVIGGNAVVARVVTKGEGAVRNTRDVDILLDPSDADAATEALEAAGFHRVKTMGGTMFLDRKDGQPSQAVHGIRAGRKVRADYEVAAPALD